MPCVTNIVKKIGENLMFKRLRLHHRVDGQLEIVTFLVSWK